MSRETFTGADVNSVAPDAFLDQDAGHKKTLYDRYMGPLKDATGTNDITASLSPDFDAGGLADRMLFSLICPAANTGPVTLSINGDTPRDLLDARGLALPPGSLSAGLLVQIEYSGSAYRLTSSLDVSSSNFFGHWVITESGVWTKPDGLDDNRPVLIEAWGGGGRGSSQNPGGGGGGGAYVKSLLRASEIPSSVSVDIGEGGGTGAANAGGDTTFGALLTAYGGGIGNQATIGLDSAAVGGGGGGSHEKGGTGAVSGNGGSIGGGANGHDAASHRGGGGGGGVIGEGGGNARHGGRADYGGGGGGGNASGTTNGGTSLYGGNGGNNGQAGQAPGGGGGRNANGARGEVRITLL